MKILITGAGGQLGRDCQSAMVEHEILPCTRRELDIADADAVDTLLEKERPQVIINAAAYTAVDKCETEKEAARLGNTEGPKNLAAAAARIDARLLHVSTDYVFNGELQVPQSYLESDPTSPLSEYGRSKLAGEQAIAASGCNAAILRTAWLYSAHGGNFLKTMLRLALADGKRELKVVNDQYGSLTWSRPLAEQLALLLNSNITGVIHATSEGHGTWYEGACYFLDRLGVPYTMRPCTTEEYPTPAHRPQNSILENSVLKAAGINVFKSWQEHLDDFISEFGEQLIAEAKASL
jgi:dTDP-4-dehydrorhamnose reductase